MVLLISIYHNYQIFTCVRKIGGVVIQFFNYTQDKAFGIVKGGSEFDVKNHDLTVITFNCDKKICLWIFAKLGIKYKIIFITDFLNFNSRKILNQTKDGSAKINSCVLKC